MADLSDLSKPEVVALALAVLGGSSRPVSTEDLALKCFELSPENFSWKTKISHICSGCKKSVEMSLPDKDTVRKSISDAKGNKKLDTLIKGSESKRNKSKDGWRLTALGARKARSFRKYLQNGSGEVITKNAVTKGIRKHSLYKTFLRKGKHFPPLTVGLSSKFVDMLETSSDSPKDIITMKLNDIILAAIECGDEELLHFAKSCAITFSDLIDETLLEKDNA